MYYRFDLESSSYLNLFFLYQIKFVVRVPRSAYYYLIISTYKRVGHDAEHIRYSPTQNLEIVLSNLR